MKKILPFITLVTTILMTTTITAFAEENLTPYKDASGNTIPIKYDFEIKRNIPASEAQSEVYEYSKASGDVVEISSATRNGHTYYVYVIKLKGVEGRPPYEVAMFDPSTGYYQHRPGNEPGSDLTGVLTTFAYHVEADTQILKKVSPTITSTSSAATSASPVATTIASSDINVIVNGSAVSFTGQEPIVQNGTTLVPVRGVFEQLGFTISWDNSTKTATLVNDSDVVVIPVGKATFTANGKTITPAVPAQTINGSTMLPLRAICESIGSEVNWDNATKTATISYSK